LFQSSLVLLASSQLLGCPLNRVPTPDVPITEDVTPDLSPDMGQDLLPVDAHDASPDVPMEDVVVDVTDVINIPVYGPEPIVGTIDTFVETLLDEPALWVRPLAIDSYVIATANHVLLISGDQTTILPETTGLEPILLSGAAKLADSSLMLVAGEIFFLVLTDEEGGIEVIESPLSDSFVDDPVRDLMVTQSGDDETIWIASLGGLHYYRGDSLTTLQPEGLSTQAEDLFFGPPVGDGAAAIWVRSEDALYALTEESDGTWMAWPEQPDFNTTAASVDGVGQLWSIHGDTLLKRSPDGYWYTIVLPSTTTAITGHNGAFDTWIRTEDHSMFHHRDGATWEASGVPEGTLAATDTEGRLLILGADTVFRVNPGRSITFGGLLQGAHLVEVQEVSLIPAFPELLESITATLDGAAVGVLTEPYRVVLDPDNFEDGVYNLVATANYSDMEEPVQATLIFEVTHVVVTWSADIEPIMEDKCADCHGSNGYVNYKLFTLEQWVENIDKIVPALETSLMPPNPFPDDEFVTLVKIWRDLEFPE